MSRPANPPICPGSHDGLRRGALDLSW